MLLEEIVDSRGETSRGKEIATTLQLITYSLITCATGERPGSNIRKTRCQQNKKHVFASNVYTTLHAEEKRETLPSAAAAAAAAAS